jgi:hypothetical protein
MITLQTFFEYAENRFIAVSQIKEIEYHANTGTFTLKVIAGAGLMVCAPYADKLREMLGMAKPEAPPRLSSISLGNCPDCGESYCSCVPF